MAVPRTVAANPARAGSSRLVARRRVGLVLTLVVILFATANVSAAASLAHKKHHLSLANVTFLSPSTQTSAPVWIAEARGYFQQQGLTVTPMLSSVSGAAFVSILLAGSANVLLSAASAQILAAQQGAPIRTIAMTEAPSPQEIAINVATAPKGIPTTAATGAQAIAQLRALKGSHLNIGVTSTTSDTYNWLVSLFEVLGMTIGPNGDINLTPFGSPALGVTALSTGKIGGLANIPPYTVQPNTIEIPLYKIPPANNAASFYMVTSTSMINQHADTVQALVNGMVEATQYAKAHSSASERYVASQLATQGITSPEEAEYLYQSGYSQFATIYPTKSSFTDEVRLVNGAQTTQLTIPYSTFVATAFIDNAFRTYHLAIPKR